MSNAGEKSKVIHLKKFDNGNRTPAEFFREQMYAKMQCSTCGDPPAMRIRFLCPLDEFKKREPQAYQMLILKFGGDPTFDTKYGKMVHMQSVFACDKCKTSARRVAAHKPSWVIAEFEEMGLEENHPTIIQVPR